MHLSNPTLHDPLPGTERLPRGLFVDRWGTLLELPERGFCSCFEDAAFVPGAVDALFRAGQAGWVVYLIGNEDAVARGKLPEKSWKQFEDKLLAQLASQGVRVQRNYSCLDHPQGKGKHRRPSVFLLPNTGLLYHAVQADRVELRESWVVGDSTVELAAGDRAGCKTCAVKTGLAAADGEFHVEPSAQAASLPDALSLLLASPV